MELIFAVRPPLKQTCEGETASDRAWGATRARVIRRRLVELSAADNLGIIESLAPNRLVSLPSRGDGVFAVVVDDSARIVLECGNSKAFGANGYVDKTKVTVARILAIEVSNG